MKRLFLWAFMLPSLAFADIPADAIRTTSQQELCSPAFRTSQYRNVSEKTKADIYRRDGIAANHQGVCEGPRGCEVDHRISLKLGGSNSPSNLLVRPYFGVCNMTQKDVLEDKLHRLMCAGKITVDAAQNYLFNDWESAYRLYVDAAGCKGKL